MKNKIFASLLITLSVVTAYAEITLPNIFSDGMVLQRNKPVRIWGWATPGETLTLEIQGNKYTVSVGESGEWETLLAASEAGGPHTLSITGDGEVTLTDILYGEVWLASGQSNMEWTLAQTQPVEAAYAVPLVEDELIRQFKIPRTAERYPQDQVAGSWQPATTGKMNFSAVAYHFARELVKEYQVPVGIINSSWGGSAVEAWMPEWSYDEFPELSETITNYWELQDSPLAAEMRELYGEVQFIEDGGNRGIIAGFAKETVRLDEWKPIELPGYFEEQVGLMIDGAVWFRKEIEVPADMEGELVLQLGAIDDFDTTYFNGVKVGETTKEHESAWSHQRAYSVPAELVKPGQTNVIAIRVFDHFGNGGFNSPPAKLRLELADGSMPIQLAGQWLYRVESSTLDLNRNRESRAFQQLYSGRLNQTPTLLYNGMIAPIEGYTISGAIWYQGESNSGRAAKYREYFPSMIRSWRTGWDHPEMPFLFVQLTSFSAAQMEPKEGGWAGIRQSQSDTVHLVENTGMAVTLDVGEADDIHPKQKQPVGERLALLAKDIAYGQSIESQSPSLKTATFDGGTVTLEIQNSYGSLDTTDGKAPSAFGIRDVDGNWHWADAEIIDAQTIRLSSVEVIEATAACYAWANNPAVNTVNAIGLPLAPFEASKEE